MSSIFLLLLACCVSGGLAVRPPKLDVGQEVVIRTTEQDDFELRCEGDKPLNWSWTSDLPPGDAEIVSEEEDDGEYRHVSTLSVSGMYVSDTGFYHCHYKTTSQERNPNDVATTYVYVYDGEHEFVDENSLVHKPVNTNQKLILDCRVTLPTTTPRLLKENVPMDISDTHRVRWDPKIGFTLLSLTVQDSGQYTCQSKSTAERQIYYVSVSSTSSLDDPIIDEFPDPHYTIGHPFFLNCTVTKGQLDVTLSWSCPNAAANYKEKTVEEGKTVISTLHIPAASRQDSGVYTCTARDTNHATTTESITISIKDTQEPYVAISSTEKIRVDKVNTTEIKWRAEISSFPPDPIIVYQDWQGNILMESDRIKIYRTPNSAFYWFAILNFTASDFGQYTIIATTTNKAVSTNKSVVIEIHSSPKVELHNVAQYVLPQTQLQVMCRVQGFPLPSVRWEFQPCVNGLSCSPYEAIEVNEGSLSYPEPGNVVKSVSSLTAKFLGFLRCVANNTLGSDNTTAAITVSDIGGLHVLNHTGVPSDELITLIENDKFLLRCGANKLHYSDVTLSIPPAFPGRVQERDTQYSFLREVKLQRVTRAVEGEYACAAVAYQGKDNVQVKKVTVRVKAEVKVNFKEDSNMAENETMEVETGDTLFLNCTVFGTPSPTVKWMKDNEPLTNTSEFFDNDRTLLSADGQRIEIEVLRREDHEGVYTCLAENRVNTVVGSMELIFVSSQGLTTPAKVGLVVALLGIAILIITVVILFKRVKTERKFRKSFRANELYLFEKGNIGQLNPDCSADEQAELLPYGQEWEVPREQISLGKQLGSGAFGRVVKAKVTDLDGPGTTTVAIKMCKSQAEQSQVRALALELKIMIHLGKHLNIVNLMGANTVHIGKGELWILVEYCRFGNLLVFMHRHRRNFVNQIDPITGHIDANKTVADSGSVVSPLSPGGSWRHDTSRGSASHDRFSATHGPPPRSPPQGTPQAHNPIYNASSGGHFLWPSNANEAASSDVSGSCCGDPKSPATTISSASDGRTQNLYFTSTSGSSVSQGHTSEYGLLDSHGKAMTHEVGSVPGVNTPFTTSHLVSWAWQVAHGMDYLSSRKVLHGDLAARNLLLADDNVVKISDFGLSRDMYKKDVYMKKSDDLMPIKWISVEAIRDRIFSVQSDVWAFGVTLWELFSLGTTPYPGIEVNKDFLQLLEDGYRMACPKYANQDIYNLLLECWDAEPMDRPSFMEALHSLGSLMQPDVREEYLNMNDQYMKMNEERFKEQPDYLNMLTPPDYENMTNKGLDDDDTKPHYINMEVAGSGRRDTTSSQHQATIQSPEMVSYCNLNLSGSPAMPAAQTTPHYLPMDATRHSPSPEDDVFTPGPDERTKFTFVKGGDKSSPNKTDKLPFLQNNHATGKSSDTEDASLIT